VSTPNSSVLWSVQQSLTDPQQTQARTNINAAKNSLVTQSADGLMSKEDKTKLDTLQQGAAQFTPIVYEQTTLSELAALYDGSPSIRNFVLVSTDGRLLGKFKYYQSNLAIFESFFVQPLRFVEYRLTGTGWEVYTFYPFDTAAPQTYRRSLLGTSYLQVNLPKMYTTLNSYLSSTPFEHGGQAISGSIWDVLKHDQPQALRYDYSAKIGHVLDGEPSGSPIVAAKIKMMLSYQLNAGDEYSETEIGGTPEILVAFNNYTQNATQTQYYESEMTNIHFSFTFDEMRYAPFYTYNSFSIYPQIEFSVLGGVSLPGSFHDLKTIAAEEQWTLISHV